MRPSPDPTLQAKAKLLEAQTRHADANATAKGMETLYSGVQTAQVIAATPQTAALADGLARSVGFKDQDAGPIFPQQLATAPPVDVPQNTSPMFPARPAGPAAGMQEGIETPQ